MNDVQVGLHLIRAGKDHTRRVSMPKSQFVDSESFAPLSFEITEHGDGITPLGFANTERVRELLVKFQSEDPNASLSEIDAKIGDTMDLSPRQVRRIRTELAKANAGVQ